MQLVDLVRVLLADGATPVDQDPQHLPPVVADHGPQPGHPGPDERDRVCVGGVGLAALPGREHGGRADSFGGTPTTCSPAAMSRS
jgi:hypothetical protein